MSSLRVLDRFWAKVEEGFGPDDCWIWTASLDAYGYGRFGLSSGNMIQAHVLSYMLIYGPIPIGLQLDHTCRHTWCVNPDHLEPVTSLENTLRGEGPSAINARKICCDHGHEFTFVNTYIRPEGKRECRECKRQRDRFRLR